MPTRPIFVLCEGSHDIAFFGRLLAVSGKAQPIAEAVKNLAAPLGDFFLKRFENRNANNAKFASSGSVLPDEPPLLESAWKLPDDSRRWYFLNCGGGDRAAQVKKFLGQLVDLAQIPEPGKGISEMGIVLVNDADEMGIAKRLSGITDNYSEVLRPILPNFSDLTTCPIVHTANYGAGTCVFSAPGTNYGTLENIVWPLMYAAFPERHSDAETFVKEYAISGTKIADTCPPSRKLKAALTIAGQPECPGYSLAVILRESLALEDNALSADASCGRFLQVLLQV